MPTLYLNGHDTEAHLTGDALEIVRPDVEKDDILSIKIPLFDIDRIVTLGRPRVTFPVLQKLAYNGIPVHMLTSHGRWVGTFHPETNNNGLRRLRQYELAKDADFAITIARPLIQAKIRNSRRVLQRLAANRGLSQDEAQAEANDRLTRLIERTETTDTVDELRGIEGMAAALYFKRLSVFFPDNIPFNGRNRRPPRDPANALLSWTYAIVQAEIDGALRASGLDPCFGHLHQLNYGRPSLSLDLLEPLRAPLCDLTVVALFTHRIRTENDFEFHTEDGGIYLAKGARKKFFREYERTMLRRFSKAKGEPHTDFRNVIKEQVNTLLKAMETNKNPEFFIMP